MQNRPPNFKWQESAPHLDMLEKFTKARDINQVINWRYIELTIGESCESAIERFERDEAIIASPIEETLECVFQVVHLKKFLQERNLKLTGSKGELIKRLVSSDRAGIEKITQKSKVMKCSAMALELLSEYGKKKQLALDLAKKQSFNALKSSDPKSAYKIYVTYQKEYVFPDFRSNPYEVDLLISVLKSQPKILSNVTAENLTLMKAIASMSLLWRDETLTSWSSSNSLSGLKNDQAAINYILVHARINESIERLKKYAKQLRIDFDSGDIDSCELCQALNGQIFDTDKVPELPMHGCTSETGCKCRINGVYGDRDESRNVSFNIHVGVKEGEGEEGADEGEDGEEDIIVESVFKLQHLKQMFNETLITKEEYEKKKAEILSRF